MLTDTVDIESLIDSIYMDETQNPSPMPPTPDAEPAQEGGETAPPEAPQM